ncbi:hypothetical protein C8R46DRAFT_5727 [Mycena filopes]|nr:hypothetical protein C8R46DRAFT_5727 [Mycena filopes]
MKRGADRQISKGEDEPEVEEASGDGVFQKADDAVLSTRKIRAMPRRLAGSPLGASVSDPAIGKASVENPATPSPAKYSTFNGFGVKASAGNPFSFAPPSSSPTFPPPPNTTSSIFGPTSGTPTPSTLFSSGTPAVAPTASNAAKTFASFLGDSSKPATDSAPPPPPQSNDTPTAAGDNGGDDAELKYYSSLRGLNVSILAAITKAIDQDPFTDVAGLLTRYNSLRVDVQKEFESRAKSDTPARSSAPSPSPFGAAPAAPSPSPAPAGPLKMPTPPAAFSGFGKPAEPKTNGGEPPAPSNPFAFPSSASTAPKPSVFAPSAASPFGSGSSTTSAFGSPAPTSSLFGSGASTSATSSPFGKSASPFGASASPFGSTASPSPFGGAKSTPSMFGAAAASGSGFGSSTPPPFSFSNGSGSIGNPVGFGFGSKGEEKGADEKKEEGDGDVAEGAGSQETESATTDEASSGSTGMLFGTDTPTGLDAEGEGEEDEETVEQARIKAFRLRKKDESGDGGWFDMGIGFLRIKKHKETSARRLLLRSSHSGKILINFLLYSGLKVSQAKKSLTFVGHDVAGEPQTYSLRFRTEDAAKEFQVVLNQEIAQIKSS